MPATDPVGQKYPARQGAVQSEDWRLGVAPNTPAGHGVQVADPSGLYCPAPHPLAKGLVDPRPQAYPGAHHPLQNGEERPARVPKAPGGQGAVQSEVVRPCVAP